MVPEELASFLERPGRSALVKGAAGTGKTLLCVEIARAAQARGREVVWMASRHMDPSESLDLESVLPPESLREGAPATGDLLAPPPSWQDVIGEIERDLEHEGTLVIIDSLEGILPAQPGGLDRLAQAVKTLANRRHATFVLVAEQGGPHAVDHLVDCVVLLEQEFLGSVRMRTCRMLKMRGSEIRRAAIPFTLSHGRFSSVAPAVPESAVRAVRPNGRHGPDGGLATTVHEWDLALQGGFRGGSFHAIRYGAFAQPSLGAVVLPLVFNALACGWRVLLAGSSAAMGRIHDPVAAGFLGLQPDALGLVTPSDPSDTFGQGAQAGSPHHEALRRMRDAAPGTPVLTLVDGSFEGPGGGASGWWSRWRLTTKQRGGIDLFLEPMEGTKGAPADTLWEFDLHLGTPSLRGQNPVTPLLLLRSTWQRGHPETVAEVVE